jgi:hypothetical protein
MMNPTITKLNYQRIAEDYGVENLPKSLQDDYKIIQETTFNFTNWSIYDEDAEAHEAFDFAFVALKQFLDSGPQSATSGKAKKKTSQGTRKSSSQSKGNSDAVKQAKQDAKIYPQFELDELRKMRRTELLIEEQNGPSAESRIRIEAMDKAIAQKEAKGKTQKTSSVISMTEHFTEEIKFIKRFAGLHNRKKTRNAILSFIKALQKSIIQRIITKDSPYASEIRTIQDCLIQIYNGMKDNQVIEIRSADFLAKLVGIAGGEAVFHSIGIMKRFIGMEGKVVDASKCDAFIKSIENAKKKKLFEEDPYLDKVNAILENLKAYKSKKPVEVKGSELNGLEGIVKSCGCHKELGTIYRTKGKSLQRCNSKNYSDSKGRGTCSYNKGLSGVMSAQEVASMQFDLLPFSGNWSNLVGQPARNFRMMVHGEPGSGKTTFMMKFIKYLCTYGRVLYVSSEEFQSATLTKLVNENLNPFPPTISFTGDLAGRDLSAYDFVVLDSINDLGISLNDFKEIKAAYPNTGFIFVVQHTKSGAYKGGKEWEHEVDTAARIEDGTVSVYKNRYGIKGEMDFFSPHYNPYEAFRQAA